MPWGERTHEGGFSGFDVLLEDLCFVIDVTLGGVGGGAGWRADVSGTSTAGVCDLIEARGDQLRELAGRWGELRHTF